MASSRAATMRSVSDLVVPTVKSQASCSDFCSTPEPDRWAKISLNSARRPSMLGSVLGVPSRRAAKPGLHTKIAALLCKLVVGHGRSGCNATDAGAAVTVVCVPGLDERPVCGRHVADGDDVAPSAFQPRTRPHHERALILGLVCKQRACRHGKGE